MGVLFKRRKHERKANRIITLHSGNDRTLKNLLARHKLLINLIKLFTDVFHKRNDHCRNTDLHYCGSISVTSYNFDNKVYFAVYGLHAIR